MYIYHKQCEIMHNIQWKGPNSQLQCFEQATSGALCWKPKTWKTRKTNTWIAQNFDIVWTIQDKIMWKYRASAFRMCVTYDGFDDLSLISCLSKLCNGCQLYSSFGKSDVSNKKHGHNFQNWVLKGIAALANRVDYSCYSFQASILKIMAVSFFVTPRNFAKGCRQIWFSEKLQTWAAKKKN